ncbi:Neutral ceramidase-like [Oopsacas minuta]|uniref:Neutral ceramidase n=1 Tax=Oopsacas minuta TaxID=111878 RepID=A0AAV7KJV8_9METZ|nr:Neutral ceramidase-like [Oopsacas minuta]
MIGVPGEFTTMSGRRLRDAVYETLVKEGMTNGSQVVIAGLSNVYSDYITTYEEYQEQRYEAASTIFGPHTLSAYIQQYRKLASALAQGKSVPSGPNTPNYRSKQLTFLGGVVYDGGDPGNIVTQPKSSYKVKSIVEVVFQTGHPKNNLFTNSTFLEVQCLDTTTGDWNVIATDSEWETKFKWVRTNLLEGKSHAVITWDIPLTTKPGIYRIKHFGYMKHLAEKITPFSGTSSQFSVTN